MRQFECGGGCIERWGGSLNEVENPPRGALAAGPGVIQGDTDVDIAFILIFNKHYVLDAPYYFISHTTLHGRLLFPFPFHRQESDLTTLGNLSQMAQP